MAELQLLISGDQVRKRIQELSGEVSGRYARSQSPVLAICVLKGAFIFFADLIRGLALDPEIDFVRMASYGEQSFRDSGIRFTKDLEVDVSGKHVLIVEDIVDTGHTVRFMQDVLGARDPQSVAVCSLIHKHERKEVEVEVDFCGFNLEKGFVVGYGLDFAEKYRRLDGIYEVLEK
jgi:hypoxanthine phosphoribosyltransferase